MKGIKIRLYPTEEQELLMWKSAGVARFSYNWGLAYLNNYYEEHKKSFSIWNLRKEFTKLRNSGEFPWLKEVSSEIPQQALKDLGDAFDRFFKHIGDYPKFKKKGKCTVSFFHLNNKFVVKENMIKLEKIGFVKMKDEDRLTKGNYKKYKIKVSNPRIKHNGRYWYLALAIEDEKVEEVELTGESIGVDLGIKELAVVSNIDKPFENINKTTRVKKLNKKLKKFQRRVSRKYDKLKSGKAFAKGERLKKTSNIIKLERKINILYKKITNIRENHIHQTTNTIVKTKPSRIVVEDLNVKGMMKNRHLAKAVQEQSFYKFTSTLEYKSKKIGIEFVKANRWFPSSKTCSACGNIKKDLKLSDRIYKCECGLILDRDKNASYNLAKYELAE